MPAMSKVAKTSNLAEREPFHRGANAYHKMGWLPFPIPHKSKGKPPSGVTGQVSITHARWAKKIDAWIKTHPKNSSIALRMPANVLCIDVDAYKEKGLDTLAEIAEDLGVDLPQTWKQSSRFDGVSGHYLFRVPEGLKWPGAIGHGIETVHSTHRYLVAAPSLHEEAGDNPEVARYLWYAPDEEMDGEGHVEPPPVDDLPFLPEEWIEYLTSGRHAKLLPEKQFKSRAASDKAIEEWIDSKGDAMCNTMAALVAEAEESMGPGAHDLTRDLVYRLGALAAEGHRGLGAALSRLFDAFAGEVERDDRGGGHARSGGEAAVEWGRFRDGAIKKLMAQEDAALFYGYPEECHCAEVGADGQPKRTVQIASYDLYGEIPRTYAALAPGPDGYGTYLHNGALTELTHRGLNPISVDYLRSLVAGKVAWTKQIGMGDASVPVPAVAPKEFLLSVLADERRRDHLPTLRGRTATPFYALGADGAPELVINNGYHPGSQMFLEMDEVLTKSVKGLEAGTYLDRARELIEEAIENFPFVGPADRAGAYAALVLPFVRDLIAGPTPLHVFHAPMARTGKSLLADVISTIVSGGVEAVSGVQKFLGPTGREANEELGKRIVGALREAPTVLYMDNVNFKVDSAELAGAMTAYPSYSARIMRTHNSEELSARCMWIMTANNLSASPEILPRIIPIRLDAKQKHPERGRSFRHPKLLPWVRESRPALVWAALTLVQNWIEAGCPGTAKQLGGFESWLQVVDGILVAAGVPDLLANRDEFEAKASDSEDGLEGLVAEWADVHGTGFDSAVLAKTLLTLESAEDIVPEDARDRARALGRKLGDGIAVGKFFIRRRTRDGRTLYFLERADGSDDEKRRFRRRVKGSKRS